MSLPLFCLLIFVPFIVGNLSQPTHELEYIQHNPGLYYERLETVRFKRTVWQVVIYLEVNSFLENHGPAVTFETTLTKCKTLLPEEECNLTLGTDLIKMKHTELEHLHHQIKEILETLGSEAPDAKQDLPSIRSRRAAPLGIIGSISKSLFGLVTSDDAETINKNIDRLFTDQASVVKLVEEQSHIVSANFQDLYNITKAHNTHIRNLEMAIAQNTRLLKGEEEKNRFMLHMLIYSRRMETKLNHLIQSTQNMLNILTQLKNGKIHPSLLTRRMIEQFKHDINRVTGDLDLPIPVEHLRPEEISSISGVDGVRKKGRVFAVLQIPLVDKAIYHLYKLHPLSIPQNLTNAAHNTAYIQPSHPYLSISTDHRYYVKMGQEDKNRCQHTHYALLCPTEQPVHDVIKPNDCEVAMLLHPDTQELHSCDIHLRPETDTQWIYLTSGEAWLFSVPGIARVRIMCPGKPTQTVKLQGIGLLRLAPNCIARTDAITLMHDQVKRDGLYYMYTPEVHLQISDVIPHFEEHKDLLINIDAIPEVDTKAWRKRGESLHTVLEKLKKIRTHRREQTVTNSLTYGSLTGNLLIIIITFTIIILRHKRASRGSWVNSGYTSETPLKPPRTYNIKTDNFSAINPPSESNPHIINQPTSSSTPIVHSPTLNLDNPLPTQKADID